MSDEDEQENEGEIQHLERKMLNRHVAAIRVDDEGGEASVVVNTEQPHKAAVEAVKNIKPKVLLPWLFGAGAEWAARQVQQPAAAAISLAVGASAVTMTVVTIPENVVQSARPPAASRTVYLSPIPPTRAVTETPEARPSPSRWVLPPRPRIQPNAPRRDDQADPRQPLRTPKPSTSQPPDPTPTSPPEATPEQSSLPPTPRPSQSAPGDAPESQEPTSQARPQSTGCDGLVHAEVLDLLDVCLLG